MATNTYTSGSVSTVEKAVMPIVSPLRSFFCSIVTATLLKSIIPHAIVRMTIMYLARMLSSSQNAGKNPSAGSSCMAFTRKSIPSTMIAHASESNPICTFSFFFSCRFIVPP